MSSRYNVIKVADPKDMAAHAAREFGKALMNVVKTTDRVYPTVILPAGMTPLPFYEEIVARFKQGAGALNQFSYVQLDEYFGLPPADKRLFSRWVGNSCLDPLKVAAERRLIFQSAAPDANAECERMKKNIEEHGGIDIAVLAIGLNGHIGFNEPDSPLDSGIRVVDLAEQTIRTNKAYWDDHPPEKGYTLGIGTLKQARRTILLVTGAQKATPLKKALDGPVTPELPASYLQKQPNTTIIADEDALSALSAA